MSRSVESDTMAALRTPVSTLAERRARVSGAWDPIVSAADGPAPYFLLACGLRMNIEGTDQEYRYRGHNDFRYLTGDIGHARVLVFDPIDGAAGWLVFAPEATTHDLVWIGTAPSLDELAETSGVRTRPLSDLAAWIAERVDRPVALLGSWDLLERPQTYKLHPDDVGQFRLDAELHQQATHALHRLRRAKDEHEIAIMRAANAASRAGHDCAMRVAHEGMTERALQIEHEAAMFRAGAEATAYGSIVLTGTRAAVLHGQPSHAPLKANDFVLIDAGAEILGYDSDVTRTFPVTPRFRAEQRVLYEVVLHAQSAAIDDVMPGEPFETLHLNCARRLAEGLVGCGLLVGAPDDLVERQAIGVFFPHGLGHLLGLATHDVGGRLDGPRTVDHPGLATLRSRVDLAPGMVMTIEPGIYFIDALLDDPAIRKRFADDIHWDRVDAWRHLGGVRIEDNVLVTATGGINLTRDIVKSIDGIEALRAQSERS